MHGRLHIDPEVAAGLDAGAAVVALESSVLAHGLPWPHNLETLLDMSAAVRAGGALPAVVGLAGGRVLVGMRDATLERFAREGRRVEKASRRDLGALLAANADGATTVSATMLCASLAGIRVFATGGIGGVHRGAAATLDVSTDLTELARTQVAVVCAGAKSVLDLSRTLEVLETAGVPVLGYGCDEFPAFYVRGSGLPVSARVDGPAAAAGAVAAHMELDAGGLLLTCPIPDQAALDARDVERWVEQALAEAAAAGITGKATTPFLLARLAERSAGRTVAANRALLLNNACVAAGVAGALAEPPG